MVGSDDTAVRPVPGGIVVGSLSQARKHKRRFDAVITLEDPACRPANRLRFTRRPSPAHLVLAFEDVDDDKIGVRVATREQVAETIAFTRAHQAGSLLVHCFHGVGRSAAVAFAIMADRLGPGAERQALEQLLAIRPQSTPNVVVVKLADDILARNGQLVAAVIAWEATTPGIKEKRAARLQMVHSNPELYTWLDPH
ncbi:tyrosine phosphatase family protein [Brevundimonas sp.]|uniref:tyrosine phosphatase family protein n=1 Tax=Brevundimonas sp. TaxID=1871086 RepID=UPI003D6D0CF8